MNRSFVSGLTLAAFLLAGLLFAPGSAFSQKEDRLPRQVQEKEYQGVPYMSGGIGEGEREALRQLETKYNLKVVYAVAQGNYLALVDTVVKDSRGRTILQATADGPWLYAKLPADTYTVTATTLQGETQEKQVRIPQQGRQEVTFTWQRGSVESR
jgi:hypothetical protein